MFYNYKILNSQNEEILYLYLNDRYEIANEFDKNNVPLLDSINNFLKNMNINFSGDKVMLINDDGIIIASINLKKEKNRLVDSINLKDKYHFNYQNDYKLNQYLNNDFIISNFVKMKDEKGMTTYVDLDNYIISLLSNSVSFNCTEEVLKCLAIIIRTNILRELYENNYLNGQKYQNISQLKNIWGKNFDENYNKLKEVVNETSHCYMTKDNYYFNFAMRNKYYIPFNIGKANNLANKGYHYLDILGHFYPDASIEIV